MIFRSLFLLFALVIASNNLYGGLFDSIFGSNDQKKSDIVIEESEPIPSDEEITNPRNPENVMVEEETISADEYLDSSSEDEKIFEDASADDNDNNVDVVEEKAISDDEDFSSETFDQESDPFIKERNILLSFAKKPDKVYLLQHFKVDIKALIPQTNIKAIATDFIGGKDFKVLNRDSQWIKTGENSYENSFYFKLLTPAAKLPNIKVTNQTQNGGVRSEILKPFAPKIVKLREDELFCKVIAKNLEVLHHQERKYDENANIVVLEINATLGNLEDFHIPVALREGIDQLKENLTKQKIFYFAIVPNVKKRFKFKYFNLSRNRYEVISFDIKPIDTKISTHTELNPQKNKYILYKVVFLIAMALLFVLLFIKYRKYYLLFIALLFIALLSFVQMPITKAKLPAGSALRILPMSNSTVFFRTKIPLEVDILLKKEKYTKVLLPNKKIGWVNNEDIR